MVHVFDRPISSEDKLERKVQRSWAKSVGEKLPYGQEDFYAKWDHSQIVSMIDGMEEAFPDRDTLSVDKASEVVDAASLKIGEQIAATDVEQKLQQLNENPSPENIAAFYESTYEAYKYVHNLNMFSLTLGQYHGKGVSREDTHKLSLHLAQCTSGITQMMNAVIPVLVAMPEAERKDLLTADVLQPYKHLLQSAVEVPLVSDMANQDTHIDEWHNHQEAVKEIASEVDDFKKTKPERREAFGRMMNHVLAKNVATAKLSGYADTFGLAQAKTGIKATDREMIAAALEHKNGADMNPVMPPRALIKMTSDNYGEFTFEEAVDIVQATLDKVHPSLGAKFTECLTQNRAHICKGAVTGAYTLPAEYNHETGTINPPRFISSFDGSLLGVWLMAHEAAHIAHLAISAENNDLANYSPSVVVMEHFSHFMELMLRDELKDRAGSDIDRVALDGFFQTHITNGMHLQHAALFQADLYHQFEFEGKEFTGKMIDDAYRRSGKEVFGEQWAGETFFLDDESFMSGFNMSHSFLPHQLSAYYGNYAASYALYEKRQEDPEAFGGKFVEAMKAGARINFEGLMDHYFGEGQYQSDNVYIKGIETLKHERDAALGRISAATKPDITVKALAMDVGSLLRDLVISRHSDAEKTSRQEITKIFMKYEPLVYHNRKAKKLFRTCEDIVKAWPVARDDMLAVQLHEMAEAVNPELGTSMKNLEMDEMLDAFARGEVIELDEYKYEQAGDQAYQIAEGAMYDPETKLVHYVGPDGEPYASEASDYIIETDRGHEAAEEIAKRDEGQNSKFGAMTKRKAAVKRNPLDDVGTGRSKEG
jgi:hypothetical protein